VVPVQNTESKSREGSRRAESFHIRDTTRVRCLLLTPCRLCPAAVRCSDESSSRVGSPSSPASCYARRCESLSAAAAAAVADCQCDSVSATSVQDRRRCGFHIRR